MHVNDFVLGMIWKPCRNSIQFVTSEAENQARVVILIHGINQSDSKTDL